LREQCCLRPAAGYAGGATLYPKAVTNITGFTIDVAAAACDAADEAVDVLLDDARQRDDAPQLSTCACDAADEAVHVRLDDWDGALQ
jgi:hypothetical protein